MVLWIDNYSKFLSRSIPTSLKDVFSSCLWTGAAAFRPSMGHLEHDMSVKHHDGIDIPAMPDDILQYSSEVTAGIQRVLTSGRNYYDNSYVKKFDSRNIPPKVDVKVYPHLLSIINNENNKTTSVYPMELLNINIGSNEGLLRIMRKLYEDYGMDEAGVCNEYKLMNVDENIYWRIMKVHIYPYLFVLLTYHQPIHTYLGYICQTSVV